VPLDSLEPEYSLCQPHLTRFFSVIIQVEGF
jgi:hypothetical protein